MTFKIKLKEFYTNEEKAANRKVWTDALRSGAFTQGNGYLCQRTPDGKELYCCLGVLAEICGLEKTDRTHHHHDRNVVMQYNYENQSMHLFPSVDTLTAVGFNDYNPEVSFLENLTNLSELNDTKGCNFSQIADIIDAQEIHE